VASFKAAGIRVKYDNSDNQRPGWKFAEYELKGVPVRIAVGPRDLENNQVEIARRDTKEKSTVSMDGLTETVSQLLSDIQTNLFERAKNYRDEHITKANTWEEFVHILDTKAGFVSAHWDGTPETEEKIKEQTKATIRCIPLNNTQEAGTCILTGAPSTQRVLFARAY
jgi:prolyl-tRNA synthetase